MAGSELRVGLIGLDMSHAPEFTRRLNVPADPEHVPGARVERFTNQVQEKLVWQTHSWNKSGEESPD
jgi:hypothetical protein